MWNWHFAIFCSIFVSIAFSIDHSILVATDRHTYVYIDRCTLVSEIVSHCLNRHRDFLDVQTIIKIKKTTHKSTMVYLNFLLKTKT